MDTEKLSYTIQEAARATGVSKSTLYDKVKSGELKTVIWGGRRLILRDELLAALDQAAQQPPTLVRPSPRL